MPIRVVSLNATPADSTTGGAQTSGAFVNVYLKSDTDEAAIQQAKFEVEEAGWEATGEVSVATVGRHSFDADSDGLSYYEQCLTDGVVVVLHTWRHEH